MKYLIPHSPERFAAVESWNPAQAAMTKQIIGMSGRNEVCSVCGDAPATDYKVINIQFSPSVGASIRLCDDCKQIRAATQNEKYAKLQGDPSSN
jgi:hypothetical protein